MSGLGPSHAHTSSVYLNSVLNLNQASRHESQIWIWTNHCVMDSKWTEFLCFDLKRCKIWKKQHFILNRINPKQTLHCGNKSLVFCNKLWHSSKWKDWRGKHSVSSWKRLARMILGISRMRRFSAVANEIYSLWEKREEILCDERQPETKLCRRPKFRTKVSLWLRLGAMAIKQRNV